MAESPLGALTRISKRLRKTASEVGLSMQNFHVQPGEEESGPHHAQVVFTFDENFTPEPEKDDEWEKFQEEQAAHAAKEREEQAKEGLAELAENLKKGGILGDD